MLRILELEQKKIDSFAYAICKHMAITVGFGVIYFALLVTNPFSALSGLATLLNAASIRWANFMRGMVVSFPSGAIGLAFGSYAFNVYSGRMALGAYSIMTWTNLAITLGFVYLSRKWGRSVFKDLTVITLMATAIGMTASLNMISIGMAAGNPIFSDAIAFGVIWKVLQHIVVFWMGYPIGRALESVIKNYGGK